jgi:SPP1 family predicted phage head-tail adaptor
VSVATLSVHTVQVQRTTDTTDAAGGIVRGWATHLTLSCRIQPRSGRERVLYSRDTETVTHIIYFPGSPDIQHKDRIKYGSRFFEVLLVRDIDELGTFLTVEAKEEN